jgi:hypothetical protein
MGVIAGYQTTRLQRKGIGENEANRFAPPPFVVTSSSGMLQRDEDPNALPANKEGAPAAVPSTAPPAAQPLTDFKDGSGITTLQEPPKSQIVTYHGNTLAEVEATLPEECGSVEFDFTVAANGDPATNVTLHVTQVLTMPQWAERDKQCPAIQKAWDSFVAALLAHENGHLAIDRTEFASAHKRFVGKPADKIDEESKALQAHVTAVQDAYDTRTDHGRKGTPPTVLDTSATCGKSADNNDGASPPTDAGAAPPTMQAKLTVNQPGDPFEQEADRIADQVLRMSSGEPSFGRVSTVVQRAILQRCACQHKEEEEQRKVQRKEEAAGGGQEAPDSVTKVLNSGGGQALDTETRAFMEPRFGHDFSRVRIHADAQAADSARAVSARAYTVGQDVVFASGEFSPATTEGKRLLAHELTHVVQQRNGSGTVQRLVGDVDVKEQKDLIRKAVDEKDPDKKIPYIKDIDKDAYGLATVSERIDMILALLNQGWVGPRDETAIYYLWYSFGKDVVDIATKYMYIWDMCLKRDVTKINDLPDVQQLQGRFKDAVAARARGYLDDNKALIEKERKRYGLEDMNAAPTAEQTKNAEDAKKAAKKLGEAVQAKYQLCQMIVAYTGETGGSPPPPGYQYGLKFNPDAAPSKADFYGGDAYGGGHLVPSDPAPPTWQDTKKEYDRASATVEYYPVKYPVLYPLTKGEKWDASQGSRLTQLGGMDAAQMRKGLAETLDTTLQNINKTYPLLTDLKKEFALELAPIHEQMFHSDPTWQAPFPQAMAKASVQKHGNTAFWDTMAVGTIGAALFVIAEFTTGGLATFFAVAGAATSAATAYGSWDKYMTFQAAANTNLNKESELISQGQVEEALVEAVMDTVFAFLDLHSAGKMGAKAIDAAERLAKGEANIAKDLAKAEAEAVEKEAKAFREAEVGGLTDAENAAHELRVKPNGAIVRCSDHCMVFNLLVADRLKQINQGLTPEMLREAAPELEKLAGRANEVATKAREIALLPEAERIAQEKALLQEAKVIEEELVGMERATKVWKQLKEAKSPLVLRDLDMGTMAALKKIFGKDIAVGLHDAETIASYEVLREAVTGWGGAYQAHHIVEEQILKQLGQDVQVCPAIILTQGEHIKITQSLAKVLPPSDVKFMDLTKKQILAAYEEAYAGHSMWLEEVRRYFH